MYCEGGLNEFHRLTHLNIQQTIYFGDQIYADLCMIVKGVYPLKVGSVCGLLYSGVTQSGPMEVLLFTICRECLWFAIQWSHTKRHNGKQGY